MITLLIKLLILSEEIFNLFPIRKITIKEFRNENFKNKI